MTIIHKMVQKACLSNDLSELNSIQIDKAMLLETDEQGNIPMLIAAATGNIKVIKFIDACCDKQLGFDAYKIFSSRNHVGCNALSIAARNQHTFAVNTLYTLGAYDTFSANQQDWETYSAMQIKAADDPGQIALQLQIDANVRLKEIYKKALYNEVSYAHARKENIRTAISLVGNVNAIIYDDQPALYHAVLNRNITAIKVLLEEGAIIEPGMLPIALDTKDEEVLSSIGQHIPFDAVPIEWGNRFDVFFDHAIKSDDARVTSNMLPHLTVPKLEEGLLYAAEIDSPDVLKCLLANGVNVNCVEDHLRARTAAMLAAKNGHAEILRILIENGADLNLRSERGPIRGLTALDYAKIKRRKQCIKIISETLTLKKYGDTPLTHAAVCGSVAELLAELETEEREGHIPDTTMLKNAIRAAKDSKQPKAVINELQKYMHDHYSRFRLEDIKKLFVRTRSKKN